MVVVVLKKLNGFFAGRYPTVKCAELLDDYTEEEEKTNAIEEFYEN